MSEEIFNISIIGVTPLILNNIALADPEYGPTKRRQEILSSVAGVRSNTKLTEAQEKELQYLEWFGSLYFDEDGRVVVPTFQVIRSLQRAAAQFRLGTAVTNGVSIPTHNLVLEYDGPKAPEDMYQDDRFKFRALVNKTPTAAKKSMVVSVRPKFYPWSASFTATVLTEVIDADNFFKVLRIAGKGQGIGNARKLGFGTFEYKSE